MSPERIAPRHQNAASSAPRRIGTPYPRVAGDGSLGTPCRDFGCAGHLVPSSDASRASFGCAFGPATRLESWHRARRHLPRRCRSSGLPSSLSDFRKKSFDILRKLSGIVIFTGTKSATWMNSLVQVRQAASTHRKLRSGRALRRLCIGAHVQPHLMRSLRIRHAIWSTELCAGMWAGSDGPRTREGSLEGCRASCTTP